MKIIKRVEIEKDFDYNKWTRELPFLKFDKDWKIKIIPPFGGAIIRFIVKKDKKEISVYLDCYNQLGSMKEPYWEIYPIKEDTKRFYLKETRELLNCIREEFKN